MARCMVCDNEYAKTFMITHNNQQYIFDCFECAIHQLAPVCVRCSCKIIGHGAEHNDQYFCCAHCAHQSGIAAMRDNA